MQFFKGAEWRGQALVEFALIIGVLFMILFVIVESGHLLHANLTVQSAAREAGRYAITGQFDTACLTESPPCADPRVESIKNLAEEKLAGLSLNPNAVFEEAGYYLIEVFGTDAAGNLLPDSAGIPGRPIIVRVSYRAPIWTPLLRPIAETIMVTGQTVMNNEKVVQAGTAGDTIAPPVPPPPPIEPTPQPPVDLVLTKSGPSSVIEGSPFRYTLSLVNSGDRDATNVNLIDTLPAGLGDASVTPSGECEVNNSIVSCSWPSVAVGEPKIVNIDVTADMDIAPTTITNRAEVTLTETDPNPDDNEDDAVTNVVPFTTETDLEIFKTGPDAAPVSTASQPFFVDYQITVRNNGPNDVTELEVTDNLPAGLTFVPAGSSGECSGGAPIVCTIDDLPNGAEVTLAIQAQTPSTPGALTNSASVPPDGDSNTTNNVASVETEFVYLADLEITKTGSPSTVNAGELLTYHIDVWNHEDSPHTATGVHISDPLPNFVDLQRTAYTAPDGEGDCAVSGNVVTCPIGTLQPGAHASATIVVIPQRAGPLINSAQVAGEQNDPDTINSATTVTMVDAVSDLAISKTVAPQDPFAGDPIRYTLTITNNGPSRATGVSVVDNLPTEVVYQFVESSYGSCEYNSDLRRVTCWIGSLPAGGVVTIWITAVPVVHSVEFVNRADVYADDDPDEFNNSDAAVTAQRGLPFIVLQPSCGPAGAAIQIDGYLWSPHGNQGANRRDITLSWLDQDDNSTEIAVIDSRTVDADGHFSYGDFEVPVGAYKEVIRIRAHQPGQGNVSTATDIETFSIPCPAPDLEVTSILSENAEVQQHEPLDYTVTINNTGDRATNEPFFVSLYAFDAPQRITSTHLAPANRLDASMVRGLDVGASRDLTLRAHHGFAGAGTHYVYAFVDSDPAPAGEIIEMYETNNLAETTIEVVEGDAEPPPPEGEQQLSGETFITSSQDGRFVPQPFVRVSLYDAPGGLWLGTTFSDLPGAEYQFTGLPVVDQYYVEASITINGVLYAFEGTVSPPPQTLTIVLSPQPD